MATLWAHCIRGCADFWVSKNDQLGRAQLLADFLGPLGVIDSDEYRHALGFQYLFESVRSGLHIVGALEADEAVIRQCHR